MSTLPNDHLPPELAAAADLHWRRLLEQMTPALAQQLARDGSRELATVLATSEFVTESAARFPEEFAAFVASRAPDRALDEAELDVVDGKGLRRFGVEAPERAHPLRRLRGCAGHREIGSAARDRDVERRLDLPQVRVERPAKVRERAIVDRRERQRARRPAIGRGRAHRRCGARRASPSRRRRQID